jgi:ABC-2 type transport system ATP-binding protein
VSSLPLHLQAGELVRFTMDLFGRGGRGGRARLDTALERVGLAEHRRKRIPNLSKGMQRRLELAALIAADPDVWLLDEPQAGLDPHGLRLLREICREARDRGRALVVSSHALGDVPALADRVIVLEKGRLRFAGGRQELLEAVGASGFVVHGGDLELEAAMRDLVKRHGGTLEGPEVPAARLEAMLFEEGGEG